MLLHFTCARNSRFPAPAGRRRDVRVPGAMEAVCTSERKLLHFSQHRRLRARHTMTARQERGCQADGTRQREGTPWQRKRPIHSTRPSRSTVCSARPQGTRRSAVCWIAQERKNCCAISPRRSGSARRFGTAAAKPSRATASTRSASISTGPALLRASGTIRRRGVLR